MVLGVVLCLAVYAMFATADIPVVTGGARVLPRPIGHVHRAVVEAFPTWSRSKGRALVELSIAVVASQVGPVILLTAASIDGLLRGVAAVEVVLATAWTVYLFGLNRQRGEPQPPV